MNLSSEQQRVVIAAPLMAAIELHRAGVMSDAELQVMNAITERELQEVSVTQ